MLGLCSLSSRVMYNNNNNSCLDIPQQLASLTVSKVIDNSISSTEFNIKLAQIMWQNAILTCLVIINLYVIHINTI